MRHYTVYQTTNLLNGKIYIGKHETNNPNDRYLGSGKLLTRAIKKHGRDNFKKEVLFDFQTEAEMNAKEAELVDEEFCLREDTYNICHGGKGGWGYVNVFVIDDEHRRLAGMKSSSKESRELHFKRLATDLDYQSEYRSLVSKGVRNGKVPSSRFKMGNQPSEEWKRNHSEFMKENQKGPRNSQFGTMWITNGTENKKVKKDLDNIPEGWYKGRKNGLVAQW